MVNCWPIPINFSKGKQALALHLRSANLLTVFNDKLPATVSSAVRPAGFPSLQKWSGGSFTKEDTFLSTYYPGQTIQSIKGNLSGNATPETINLEVFQINDNGEAFAKLVVRNSAGEIVAESPEVTDIRDPRAMGVFDWGTYELRAAGAIDCGTPSVYVAVPRSDVRPEVYAIWRWDEMGQTLEYEAKRCLVTAGGAEFHWAPLPQDYGNDSSWIESMQNESGAQAPGEVEGVIVHYYKVGGSTKVDRNSAKFRVSAGGLKVIG